MAVAIEVLAKQIVDSGLLPEAELKSLIVSLPPDRRPKDGEQLARELVRQKKLTSYQAQQAYSGKARSLMVGNYVVLDKLGQGGMGTVVKAEHRRMQRMVALKVISTEAMKSPDAVKRFHREVQAAARLIHQNIVTAFDADEFDGRHVLVMEFVDGEDLSSYVKKNGPLPVEKAVHCIYEAARGLEYAHKQGVVHRDIKPGNLLLSLQGAVKILDMGLARLDSTQEQAEITSTGQVMGTIDYMAPEQAMSTKQADGRADIYSLGLTFWYLLAAKPAYTGDSIMEKLLAHRERAIPSLRELRGDVSPAIEAVFRKMAAKTPEERYASMTALLTDLDRVRSGETAAPAAPAPPRDDSKLNSFLAGQSNLGRAPGASGGGNWSPNPPTPAGGIMTAAARASTGVAPEETVDRPASEIDTDASSQPWAFTPAETPVVRPSASPPPPPRPAGAPWWNDWRVLVGIGVGTALLVFLLGLLIFGGKGNPPAVDPKAGSNLPAVNPATAPGVAAKSPADPKIDTFSVQTNLFNGTDLTGWKVKGAQGWSASGGVLVGQGTGANGWLCSEREFGDYQMELEYRIDNGCNSGLFPRAPENADLSGRLLVEVQLLDNAAFPVATELMRHLAVHSEVGPQPPPGNVVGAWHKLTITVIGSRITIDHDGARVVSHATAKLPARGHFGVQLKTGRVELRNLVLREPA